MAVAFHELWSSRGSVLDELRVLQAAADDAREDEAFAALRVQRLFRGQRVRARVAVWQAAALFIERVFRGHQGRSRSRAAREEKRRNDHLAVFHYHAVNLQKCFRGYYSRRYYHDFFARKAYLDKIVANSEGLRKQLAEQREQQRRDEEEQAAQATQAEFAKVTQNLHHLVSTASQPGIYNSPYVAADQVPTAYGVPFETHLRTGVKDLLRTRAAASRGQPRVPPPLGFDQRLSVQATSKYGVDKEAMVAEAKQAKARHLGSLPFSAGGTARDLKQYRESVDKTVPYLDKWRNPYAQRGVPQGQDDMDPATTTLGKYPVVPFYTSVGGNKSVALANDRFDVMTQVGVVEESLRRQASRTANIEATAKAARAVFEPASQVAQS